MYLRYTFNIRITSSLVIATIAVFSLCNPVLSHAEDAGYHVTDKQHLDGDVKWDYLIVDAEHRHLFITHGDRVDVFDVDKKLIVEQSRIHMECMVLRWPQIWIVDLPVTAKTIP